MKPKSDRRPRAWFGRYVRFCIVGTTGVAVDMSVLWLLSDPATLGWNLTAAKVVAGEIAILNNFLWNDLWTFRGVAANSLPQSVATRLFRFHLICFGGLVASVLLLNAQVRYLGIDPYLANFFAIVLISVANFFLNLRFGWQTRNPPAPAANIAVPWPGRPELP